MKLILKLNNMDTFTENQCILLTVLAVIGVAIFIAYLLNDNNDDYRDY